MIITLKFVKRSLNIRSLFRSRSSQHKMAATGDTKSSAAKSKQGGKTLTQEQIIEGFQELRNQQKVTAGKMAEVEMDRKEHDLVLEALKGIDAGRKCFRMVGGVLVERTVAEVLPAIATNYEQLGKLHEALQQQLETRGRELQEYREKHNIRIRGEEERGPASSQDSAAKAGVLVAQDGS